MTFLKPNTSVIGSGEPIIYPKQTTAVDHEGELAVVIGRICKDVPVERVPEVIFGYTCSNDVSARDLQQRDKQWGQKKGASTPLPFGPWIVTHLSLEEASDLRPARHGHPQRRDPRAAELYHEEPRNRHRRAGLVRLLVHDPPAR